MNAWDVGQLVLWLVVLFNLVLTIGLVRRLRTIGGGAPAGRPNPGGLPAGVGAPDFSAPDGTGVPRRRSELGGGPVALAFFSPGCPSCVEHAPEFGTFAERAGGAGISAVAVLDTAPGEAAELVGRLGDVQVLYAPRDANPLLADYGIDAYPTYTVIGADGRVARSFGAQPELDRWLAEQGTRRSAHSHP